MGFLKKVAKVATFGTAGLLPTKALKVAGAAAIGTALGGPTAGLSAASSVYGVQQTRKGQKEANAQLDAQTREAANQTAQQALQINEQKISATKLEERQKTERDQALQKLSLGRVRASQRRVRGGLFGDNDLQVRLGA